MINQLLRYVGLRLVRHQSADRLRKDMRGITNNPIEASYRAGLREFIIEIPLSACRRGSLAFPLIQGAGDPFIETLLAYMRGTCKSYDDSPLQIFFEHWKPANAAEALCLNPEEVCDELCNLPPIVLFPWWNQTPKEIMHAQKIYCASECRQFGIPECDINSDSFRRLHYKRLIDIYNKIKIHGFKGINQNGHDITGEMLIHGENIRFVLRGGQHRTSVLAAIGYHNIPLRVRLIVRREDYRFWPYVRDGLFTTDQALFVFDRVFSGKQPQCFSKYIS